MSFFYAFTETILHSTWQAGLCVLLYTAAKGFMKNSPPLQKRNFLFGLLAAQLIISLVTFFIYYTGNTFSGSAEFLYSNSIYIGIYQYADIIFYAYAVALIFHSFKLGRQWQGFKNRYRRGIARPEPELKVFTELKAIHLGIKRKVTLWYSAHVDTPLTFGMLKPVILLPLSLLNHISMQETEAIILHELAHIKSMDHFWNRFLILTETLYFFNPFVRMLAKQVRIEREKNCDVQVINFKYPELLYAEALLKTARFSRAIRSFQLGAVAGTPQLLERIKYFTEDSNLLFNRRKAGFLSALLIPFFFLTALFFLPGTKAPQQAIASLAGSPVSIKENPSVIHYAGVLPAERAMANTAVPVIRSSTERPAPEVSYDAAETENNVNAIAAAYNETPDSVKEFIYKVETPQGMMTQSYKLVQVKGQWIMQPQWMVLETPPDSLKANPADTIIRIAELPQ